MRTIGAHCLDSPSRRPERGAAMLGMLAVVVILGVIAVIVLDAGPSTPKAPVGSTSSPGPTTTAPRTVASAAQLAAVSACRTDFTEVTSALDDYRALNGASPPAGSAWATSAANGGPLLTTWPADPPFFTLTWNGSTLSVIPIRGAPSHGSPGSSTDHTGCFAAGV